MQNGDLRNEYIHPSWYRYISICFLFWQGGNMTIIKFKCIHCRTELEKPFPETLTLDQKEPLMVMCGECKKINYLQLKPKSKLYDVYEPIVKGI